jgi:hypothetical protein
MMGERAVIEILKKHGEMLQKSKDRQTKWVEEAAPVLIDVNGELKQVKAAKEEGTRLIRIQLEVIAKPFDTELSILNTIDKALRKRLLEEYPGSGAIAIPEGEISFRRPWTYDVVDEVSIPDTYRTVDQAKIKQAVDGGVRAIPGVKIYQGRTIVVKAKE